VTFSSSSTGPRPETLVGDPDLTDVVDLQWHAVDARERSGLTL